ncbi:MAG TPA: hypothetical protein VHT30_05675 [Acidimicrobiales bacterium]|jgi:translation elongation factor EF-Tu-like GTPase|nr:hypothetical protein [Acidimicrobiales bacterium]
MTDNVRVGDRDWAWHGGPVDEGPFELEVREVFNIDGRAGPIVTGPLRRGALRSREATELVDRSGTVIPVPQTFVEIHSRPGELAVVLAGVDPKQVQAGQLLRKRDRWPCYSQVHFLTDEYLSQGAPKDAMGWIVEVYGNAYEVEVSDSDGSTLFLGAVTDEHLELLTDDTAPS